MERIAILPLPACAAPESVLGGRISFEMCVISAVTTFQTTMRFPIGAAKVEQFDDIHMVRGICFSSLAIRLEEGSLIT